MLLLFPGTLTIRPPGWTAACAIPGPVAAPATPDAPSMTPPHISPAAASETNRFIDKPLPSIATARSYALIPPPAAHP